MKFLAQLNVRNIQISGCDPRENIFESIGTPQYKEKVVGSHNRSPNNFLIRAAKRVKIYNPVEQPFNREGSL